ncbi:MAG TPA: glycoside hydrolase family 15 protein [Thermoanaerobaculia bacterium]|jgi:GH15 family glucan-1,4-alpha-glucosidase|nr:glycoside hydrolase family 15 protein [Thermoanaerobaculia bacterium]
MAKVAISDQRSAVDGGLPIADRRALVAYLPIAAYGAIGDTRSCALVSAHGSIDWLCWPRFDSPSLFARLLDSARGGHFFIRPEAPFRATRRYLPETNVLETTFTTDGGVAVLLDLMPVMSEQTKTTHLAPFRQLLRRIEVTEGEVPLVAEYAPRFDYARVEPKLAARGDCVYCADGPVVLYLRTDAPLTVDGTMATARFTLTRGERKDFALAFDSHSPAVLPLIGEDATHAIERTVAFWRKWVAQCVYKGPYRDAVMRSALLLKLMSHAPSGAIVAAPTTSLPERIGGIRNWDYRYCWLRDASFTVAALDGCGFEDEGGAFVDWLLYATRLTQPGLQVLYDVFGEPRVPERELAHLDGYMGSRPVRIGNDARDQFQLDTYAEVLGAAEEWTERDGKLDGAHLPRDVQRVLVRLADKIVQRWREPDSGIWEKRSGLQQHVHAKVMAWAGLDCAIRLAEHGIIPNRRVDAWRREREQVRRLVLQRGFNARLNSFVAILDGDELDASLLYIARVGFLPADDPRMLGTVAAIRAKLGRDELIYRYELGTQDGLPPGEGAFLACSFWLVEALALAGRREEAHDIFGKLLERGNDLGLFSEEVDVESGQLLGNFPQALTHIGLINAALCLAHQHQARSEKRSLGEHGLHDPGQAAERRAAEDRVREDERKVEQ